MSRISSPLASLHNQQAGPVPRKAYDERPPLLPKIQQPVYDSLRYALPAVRPCRTARKYVSAPHESFLNQQASVPSSLQEMWQDRQAFYQHHLGRLSHAQCLAWGLRNLSERLLSSRKVLTHVMFPIANMSLQNTIGRHEDFRQEAPNGRKIGDFSLTPVGVINRDHLLLDGMRVICETGVLDHRPRPIMVFVPPNGMMYEELLVPACRFAEVYNSEVLLFNYRGVAKSMGKLHAIQDAVTDTAAFISYACSISSYVGVLGLSMGGGTGAAALAQLQATGSLMDGDVSLFMAVHTFTSWFDVAQARRGRTYATAFFGAVRLLGMRDLKTQDLIEKRPVARQTLVLEAACDRVIPHVARLGWQIKAGAHVDVIRDAGAGHADLTFLGAQEPSLIHPADKQVHQYLQGWRATYGHV